MDNFQIDITSEGALDAAMRLAFQSERQRAVGYRIDPEKGIVLYQYESAVMTPFPFKMDAAGAADFVKRWLAEADYGPEPDHDGHNEKGWRLYNEAWGHVGGDYKAFVAVKPAWAMYGK